MGKKKVVAEFGVWVITREKDGYHVVRMDQPARFALAKSVPGLEDLQACITLACDAELNRPKSE